MEGYNYEVIKFPSTKCFDVPFEQSKLHDCTSSFSPCRKCRESGVGGWYSWWSGRSSLPGDHRLGDHCVCTHVSSSNQKSHESQHLR